MTPLLKIIGLALITPLLFGSYFYLKKPGQKSIKQSLGIFLMGTISILPVILFHKWVLADWIFKLKEKWPILENPFLESTAQLGMLVLFILTFVTIFGFLNTLFKPIQKKGTRRYHVPIFKKLYNLTPILLFFLGILSLEGVTHIFGGQTFVLSTAGAIIVFAVLEEYFKYTINPFLVNQKIHAVGSAMVNALYVGLAFAFVENILFFYVNYGSPDFQRIVIYRSIFTTLLHVCASGILGYFYGTTLFSNSILANYEIEKGKYNLPFWVRAIFKKETIFKSISVNQGFFIASLVHAGFNLFLNLGMRNLASGIVIVLAITVLRLLHAKPNQIQYGLIGSNTMPQLDFEKLRLQIAVLKAQKEIQQERYGKT